MSFPWLLLNLKFSYRDRSFVCNNSFSPDVDLGTDQLLLKNKEDEKILKDIDVFEGDLVNVEHRLDMLG